MLFGEAETLWETEGETGETRENFKEQGVQKIEGIHKIIEISWLASIPSLLSSL